MSDRYNEALEAAAKACRNEKFLAVSLIGEQYDNLPAIQGEAADRIEDLERENAVLRTDNRKLALHTAEQAKELGKLRDQLEEAQDKALRFDIDSVGIERREAEGAELVTLRAELSAAQARIAELEAENAALRERIAELEKAVVRAMEATAFSSHEDTVGYRVCCDVRSYEPHKKNCYLRAALAKEKP